MTDYISKRLGKEKAILIGHSYGTYIGMQAANKAPEKYEAYVGIGQMSDTLEGEMDSLKFVIDQAENAGNKEEVSYLNGLTEKKLKWRYIHSAELCWEIWWNIKTH